MFPALTGSFPSFSFVHCHAYNLHCRWKSFRGCDNLSIVLTSTVWCDIQVLSGRSCRRDTSLSPDGQLAPPVSKPLTSSVVDVCFLGGNKKLQTLGKPSPRNQRRKQVGRDLRNNVGAHKVLQKPKNLLCRPHSSSTRWIGSSVGTRAHGISKSSNIVANALEEEQRVSSQEGRPPVDAGPRLQAPKVSPERDGRSNWPSSGRP